MDLRRFLSQGQGNPVLLRTQLASEKRPFKLLNATITFSSQPSTSENATITHLPPTESRDDAHWDAQIDTVDSSGTTGRDTVFTGAHGDVFEAGSELRIDFANTDRRNWGARILVELIEE